MRAVEVHDVEPVVFDAVAAIVGSRFSVPFQPSSAVWLVLLRTRPTSADARRRAEHYWLDIVHFDGAHQTIGAYPSGALDFAHDAAHLLCVNDKERDENGDRAIPVTPGLGQTPAQLASALGCLCDGAAHANLRYRVHDADDDKFVADILFRAGVLVGPLLREAVSH